MRLFPHVIAVVAIGFSMIACDPAGNGAPGGLSDQGDYSSKPPTTDETPCANLKTKQSLSVGLGTTVTPSSNGNCGVVPDPYGVPPKKDLTPKISFQGYPTASPEILVLPGNAYGLIVTTANVTEASVSIACVPSAAVSLTLNGGGSESFLLYLGGMLNKDITCTLSGSGEKGNTTATLTFKVAPSTYIEKLEVRNLPTLITLDTAGESITFNNFYVRGYDKTTTTKVSCSSGQAPKLVDVAGKAGWYSMTVVSPDNVGLVEKCTVSATRSSDGQSATATVALSAPDIKYALTIAAGNFKDGDAMFMIPLDMNTANYAALIVDHKEDPTPLPKITVHSLDDDLKLDVSCTDNNGAGFVPSCDAAPTCTKDPAYLQCQAPCGVPGDAGYLVCVNNCFDTIYNPCTQKTCPFSNHSSEVTKVGKMMNPADTYELKAFINYKDIGKPDSVDTCTITAVNSYGAKASYALKVRHVIPSLKPAAQLPIKADQVVTSESFTVINYDGTTDVKVSCTADGKASLTEYFSNDLPPKPLGVFYIKTVAPSKVGDSNICTVTVAHGSGAPVPYRTMTVTVTP